MRYSDFAKGIATGMVMGAAATMIFEPSDKQKNKIKRKTRGVFRSIGSVIDTAVDMVK